MAIDAECDQIMFTVVTQVAPRLDVMYLQVRPTPTALASPTHHAAGPLVATIDRVRPQGVVGLAWEEHDSWHCFGTPKNLFFLFRR